ncbi:MAG: DNA-directed RNA polymerase subunit beta', partial [Alphaproteobacteria bacterium]
FGKDYKTKRRISIAPSEADQADGVETVEYMIPKGKHISVQEGDFVEKGDLLLDGSPVPHDILRVMGLEALAAFLVKEIQDVYRLQGVPINDKHIEVIVRQMLQKVEITKPGDSTFLAGEQVDRAELDEVNVRVAADGGVLAEGTPVLQGITKASLQTRSFISAASFQETTRVLTEAAVNGKIDQLSGLKENVIVGRLIPAGTGRMIAGMREIAAAEDKEFQARLEEAEEARQALLAESAAADEAAAESAEQSSAA